MDGIIEYAQAELAPFGEKPLHEVDSLLFSQLCYLRFGEAFPETRGEDGRALHDTFHLERFDPLYRGQRDEDGNHRLLSAVAASPRYRDVRVCRYVNEVDPEGEMQFSATTFVLPGGAGAYIAFRGTDSTLVGWKENFNMAYRYPVPGQVLACSYLNGAAGALPGRLHVGGHSKGGNLAVYAATQCGADVQDRIAAVFDHDGPGFGAGFYGRPAFTRLEGRLRKTMPESAVVGMLMETVDDYRVVRSSAMAILQHDPFTWEVDVEAGDFAAAAGLSRPASRGDAVITEWVDSFDGEQRGVFVDTLFQVLAATGAETTGDLKHIGTQEIVAAADVLRDADPQTRQAVIEVVGRLVRLVMTPQATWNRRTDGAGDSPGGQQEDQAERAWSRLREKMSAFLAEE